MEELAITGRGNGAHKCKGMRQEKARCVQGTTGLPGFLAKAWEVQGQEGIRLGQGEKTGLQVLYFMDFTL